MFTPKRLSPRRLRAAALQAMTFKAAAAELATEMAVEGGAPLAADRLKELYARTSRRMG